MNDDKFTQILQDNLDIIESSLETHIDNSIRFYNDDSRHVLQDYLSERWELFDKDIKTIIENQKKSTSDSLKKEIISSKTEILEELKRKKLNENKSSIALQKSDFDNYFKSVNDNINNHLSLFEGFFMGVVIMYIFFSRLFKNV